MKTARQMAHELAHWDGYPRCGRWRHGPTCDHLARSLAPLVDALAYIASLPCVCGNADPATCSCPKHLAGRALGR